MNSDILIIIMLVLQITLIVERIVLRIKKSTCSNCFKVEFKTTPRKDRTDPHLHDLSSVTTQ